MTDWIARDEARVWHGFTQMSTYSDNQPIIVERAEGHELIDVNGKRYLDAISSLWVTTLGHRVPELDAAVVEQLGKVAHSTLLGNGNRVVIELAEALTPLVPVEDPRFLFASDGAAAVEQALKIAFQYWTNQGITTRSTYLAFGGAYHGDTVGSLSLGGGGFGTDVFDPLRFPVLRAPGFDDPDAFVTAAKLIRSRSDDIAAAVVEPLVQGAAGIISAPPEEFALLQEACDDTGVLLICDEVATGFGRTGTLFASERCALTPDIMALGKGITGGYLPLSATVTSGRVATEFLGEDLGAKTLYHGHSYQGNALAAAVALRHLELIEEWDVLANVRERSGELAAMLETAIAPLDAVKDIRLEGLMCGVELQSQDPQSDIASLVRSRTLRPGRIGRRVCAAAVERGVLLRPLGDVVVLMPHLTVRTEHLERIVAALEGAILEVCP